MNINYELYKVFYTVANHGNITSAAEELCISQPAVTKHIKNLEDSLGCKLFVRMPKGVKLTENGKEIFNYIKEGINYFNNAELMITNLEHLNKGTLKIGISTKLTKCFLLDYLKDFHDLYPKINITIYTDPTSELKKMLKDSHLDLIIGKYLDKEDELNYIELGKLNNIFIASNKYNELKDRTISLAELKNYPILLQKKPATIRKLFDNYCKDNNIEFVTNIEVASANLLESFVEIGFGIGIATKEFVLEELKSNKIFEVKVSKNLDSQSFGIYTLSNSINSFSTNKFIELLTKRRN